MALTLLAHILHEHLMENMLFLASADVRQLSRAVLGLAATEFIGFTLLWTDRSSAERCRRHCYYRLAALFLCATYLTLWHPLSDLQRVS